MVGILMVGAGEYTAGYVPTKHGAASDKPAGVVALTCFDLRRKGLVDRLVLCDACGTKMAAVRATLQSKIGDVYKDLDVTVECFPADDVQYEPLTYLQAIASMSAGDVVIIFTPDNTHFEIAAAAVRARLHVLVAKPAVKTLAHHRQLVELAESAGVLVAVEFHKRFDPIYADARNRIRTLGPFSHFSSFMSQPKQQIETFRSWAGRASDISYYLNSHHIDMHAWSVRGFARPTRVQAMAATGVAESMLGHPCEDTITLMVQWENYTTHTTTTTTTTITNAAGTGAHGDPQGADSPCRAPPCCGSALYTASWSSARGDCHTQQQFHYMGHGGELRVDQAHRGFTCTTHDAGHASLNPLYMRYTPDATGHFAGQTGYGYISIAAFISAAQRINSGACSLQDVRDEDMLAVIEHTLEVTAILEAGRLSLDAGGAAVTIGYDGQGRPLDLCLGDNR